MNPYLAKLRGLSQENHYPSEPSKPSKPGFEGFEGEQSRRISGNGPDELGPYYGNVLGSLQSKCPELIEPRRWEQAIQDAESFVAKWGARAHALGWTAQELFGLHPVAERPVANYERLSRYDATGLIWLLQSRQVVALTEATAAIQGATAVLTYRKHNKSALGPLGDSVDDFDGRPPGATP
jgi:hypothetical protein